MDRTLSKVEWQGRMVQPPESSSATSVRGTSFVALAMKQDGTPVVQLEILNDKVVVLVGGEELDFAGLTEQRLGNVTIVDLGNNTFAVRFRSGVSVQRVHILTNIVVTIPEHFSTRGLLGQFNGDALDDLLPRSAALPLSLNSTTEDIHHQFGITCEISNEECRVYSSTAWFHFTGIVDDPRRSLFTSTFQWQQCQRGRVRSHHRPHWPPLPVQGWRKWAGMQVCSSHREMSPSHHWVCSTMDSVLEQEKLTELFAQST